MSRRATLAEIIGRDGLFCDGDWVESKDQDPSGDVRLVQLADVGDGTYLDKSARFMTSTKASALRCTFLQPGDILIARMPDPLGRACVFPGDPKPCVTVVDVAIARPGRDVDTRWLVSGINSPAFRMQIAQHVKGTTRERISRTNLASLALSVPTLVEQRRIADILDKADAIRRKRKEAIALTEDLLRSTFLEMFGDPVTNPKGWPTVAMEDVCGFFAGNSLPKGQPFAGQTDGLLLLKVGDMNLPGNETYISIAREWTKSQDHGIIAPAGSVIIPKRGGAISTNKKRLLTRPAALDPNLMAISPKERISIDYLYQWFSSFDLCQLISGSAVPQLNKKDLAPLVIPLPSLAAQRRFAAARTLTVQMESRLRSALAEAEALFACLVDRAFRGELTSPSSKSLSPTEKQLALFE